MLRTKIIENIGEDYLKSNIENEEFSYAKALKKIGKNISNFSNPKWNRQYQNLDLRFVDSSLSILVETKANFRRENKSKLYEQVNAYITFEKALTNNKIVAIVANTEDDSILVFKGDHPIASDDTIDVTETKLKRFEEYKDGFFGGTNDKLKVVRSTYALNELLNKFGIDEDIRSQFVGTCLLALKNNLNYDDCSNAQIRAGIETVLTSLLEKDLNKATKLAILKKKVLDSQDVKSLSNEKFRQILSTIKDEILPFINDKNTQGQDILNLFFTTFNKYVGKTDKNQAFTPDHIVHFMCKVCNVNRNSYVLDPCCGSGAFLVRALTEAMDDCKTEKEKNEIKKKHIFGIEYEEGAFGLSTTNMLIHGDGNSNIIQGSCFSDLDECLRNAPINVVLMNPPYNATTKQSNPAYVDTWGPKVKFDPSKGFHYVYYIASKIHTGKLAVLLPMSCAIGGKKQEEINKFKKMMLEEHQLEAVFSLPADMFHPGATASACCMVFNLGERHEKIEVDEDTGAKIKIVKNLHFLDITNMMASQKRRTWAELKKLKMVRVFEKI